MKTILFFLCKKIMKKQFTTLEKNTLWISSRGVPVLVKTGVFLAQRQEKLLAEVRKKSKFVRAVYFLRFVLEKLDCFAFLLIRRT